MFHVGHPRLPRRTMLGDSGGMDTDRLWQQSSAAVARFGREAEAYDRYRHGYPGELFGRLADACGLDGAGAVVDVGAGTGIASLGLAPLCSTLVCVEPSAEMAALARARLAAFPGASVVEASFERWEPTVADVDVVASA